jgi:hypothetical protein
MPGPVLSPEEIAQLKKDQAKAAAAAETYTANIAGQQAEAARLAVTDGAFKKFFDYYNNDIIGKYDLERKALNGQYVDTPIVEADIISAANLQGGRLQPSLPATDLVRIGQFDGTPLLNDPLNESQGITDQALIETALVSGYGGTAPANTVVTATALTAASTTLKLTDPSATYSIAPNSIFVVAFGGDLAVIKVLTFVMQVTPAPPPYVANLTIEVLVPPSGTISTGANLTVFNGFSNSERNTKTAASPSLQPLMNYLVTQLQAKVNLIITSINYQLSAIGSNQDPDGTANFNQASVDANTSKTFLTNYLITTNINNSGIGTLSVERGVRSGQITTRLSQINAAYTGQTLNYYNERYNSANNRGNTARGSLRLQKAAEQNSSTSAAYASTLTAQANAIGSILP